MRTMHALIIAAAIPLVASKNGERLWNLECPLGTWDGTQVWNPKEVFQPSNADDVVKIVQKAVQSSPPRKVKAVGGGFTHDPLGTPEDILICTNKLVGDFQLDTEKKTITVMAGMHTGDLMDFMAAHQIFIEGFLQVPKFRIGGVLSAGVGPINREHPLYKSMESIQIVDGMGNLLDVTPESHLWMAMGGGLGLTGIIVQATFKYQEAFKATKRLIRFESLEDALQKSDDLVDASLSWEFWWTPKCRHPGRECFEAETTVFQWVKTESVTKNSSWGDVLWEKIDWWPRIETLYVEEDVCSTSEKPLNWSTPTTPAPCHTEFSLRFPSSYLSQAMHSFVDALANKEFSAAPVTILFWASGSTNQAAKLDTFLRPSDYDVKYEYKKFFDNLGIPGLKYYPPKEVEMTIAQCPPQLLRKELDPHNIFINEFTKICENSPDSNSFWPPQWP